MVLISLEETREIFQGMLKDRQNKLKELCAQHEVLLDKLRQNKSKKKAWRIKRAIKKIDDAYNMYAGQCKKAQEILRENESQLNSKADNIKSHP